jgi:hypothetical protein
VGGSIECARFHIAESESGIGISFLSMQIQFNQKQYLTFDFYWY